MTSEFILPMSPAPAAYRLRMLQGVQVNQSLSGKILTRRFGGQYYELTLVYNPMHRSDAAELISFLQLQRSRSGIFSVPLDNLTGLSGVTVGNFANYDNDSKVHLITGIDPLVVSPEARLAGGSLSTTGVTMRCSLRNNVQEITLGKDGLIKLEIDLVERI